MMSAKPINQIELYHTPIIWTAEDVCKFADHLGVYCSTDNLVFKTFYTFGTDTTFSCSSTASAVAFLRGWKMRGESNEK